MAENNGPFITKIKMPSSTVYYLKDEAAWASINALTSQISTITNGMHFLGSLGALPTNNEITINIEGEDKVVTAEAGDLILVNTSEYLWTGNYWELLGDLTALSTDIVVTPSGTISTPTFTGSSSNVNITVTDNTSGNYQPKGSISTPAFTGTTSTFSGSYQPAGTVSTPDFYGNEFTLSTNYQPEGAVSTPTFNGATSTFTGPYTPAGNINITLSSSGGSSGYINEPTSKTVIGSITGVQPTSSDPGNSITYCAVQNETLDLYYLQALSTASITTTSKTVVTADAVWSASATFSGTITTVSVSGIPKGSISQPTFTGTTATITLIGTPSGTISQPNFTGTTATISVSGIPNGNVGQPVFTGTTVSISGTVTPSGTISQPTFYGNQMRITITSA